MYRLDNVSSGKEAVVIFGGSSILSNKYDLSLLADNGNVIFLESKALTPEFVNFNITPDYYFMPYPEKTRTNSLQHVFIQAISSGYKLEKSLKKIYIKNWSEFKDRFDKYAEIWRIEYPNKKYRVKKNIILKDSPVSLLKKFPDMKIITCEESYNRDGFSLLNFPNKVYQYTHGIRPTQSIYKYLNPKNINKKLVIDDMGFVNSAAISMYPILKYMGFKKVTLIGMDMSMLGSMEFSAPFTFKSMGHYGKFFNASRQTFSHNFPRGLFMGFLHLVHAFFKDLNSLNIRAIFSCEKYSRFYKDVFGLSGKFMRERGQLRDAEVIFKNSGMEFTNIYEPFEYSQPIPGVKNISYKEYLEFNKKNRSIQR
jgi:hypothetical protein